MRKTLNVLCLQFEPIFGDKDKNLKRVAKLFDENANFHPDVVILPEVWNIGTDYECFQKEAEFIPDQTTMLLSSLAENYNTYIIGGSIIEKTYDGKFYNTCLVFDKNGAVIAKYRKNHVFSHCSSQEGKYIQNGTESCVVDIAGIKFGIAICYDIRFPELFRKMVLQGAQVFAVPAAFPQERIEQWNILNQARALENLCMLISCNQYGNSNFVSPYGKILKTSSQKEEAIRNILQRDEILQARKNTPFLDDIK